MFQRIETSPVEFDMLCAINHNETDRINAIYSQRGYDNDPEYSDINPVYLHRMHSIERAILAALKNVGFHTKLADLKVLDFGCGNGRWFGRWIAWGATPANLTGVDVRAKAIEMASDKFPQCIFQTMTPRHIPFANESFDIVFQNVVFSSILDSDLRHETAAEMVRVLKPNGVILWCDFIFNNPNNPNVKAVKRLDIKNLFPDVEELLMKRIILAPPIAKILVPLSWLAAEFTESCFPFLRTHVFAVLRKRELNSSTSLKEAI